MAWFQISVNEKVGIEVTLDPYLCIIEPFYVKYNDQSGLIPIADIGYTYDLKDCTINIFDHVITSDGTKKSNNEVLRKFVTEHIVSIDNSRPMSHIKTLAKKIIEYKYVPKNHNRLFNLYLPKELMHNIKNAVIGSSFYIAEPVANSKHDLPYSLIGGNTVIPNYLCANRKTFFRIVSNIAYYHFELMLKNKKQTIKKPIFYRFNELVEKFRHQEITKSDRKEKEIQNLRNPIYELDLCFNW